MKAKLGPGADNGRRPVVGERSVTIDAPTVLPTSNRGPSEALVAAVAIMAALLLFGAGLVTVRHELPQASDSQSPATSALACWDGSMPGAQGCPKLDQIEGMTWLFTPSPAFSRCERRDPETGSGELGAWYCYWDDVEAEVLISRWDSTQSAVNYYQYFLGPPRHTDVATGDQGGLVFSSLTPNQSQKPQYAFAYAGHPYSFIVTGSQVERDRAVARLQVRDPARIRV